MTARREATQVMREAISDERSFVWVKPCFPLPDPTRKYICATRWSGDTAWLDFLSAASDLGLEPPRSVEFQAFTELSVNLHAWLDEQNRFGHYKHSDAWPCRIDFTDMREHLPSLPKISIDVSGYERLDESHTEEGKLLRCTSMIRDFVEGLRYLKTLKDIRVRGYPIRRDIGQLRGWNYERIGALIYIWKRSTAMEVIF